MSIAYLSIQSPDWFTFETALVTTDFLFEQVNIRPDGKRPTRTCVSACYLAMFGEYAKVLQNEGTSLEDCIKNKTNWQHLWKESVTSYETDRTTPSDAGSYTVPNDLAAMVKSNSSLIRSVQGHFDRKLNGLARQNDDNGDRKDGDKRPGFNRGRKGQGKKGGKDGKKPPTRRPERTERLLQATVQVLGANASKAVSDYPVGVLINACVMT